MEQENRLMILASSSECFKFKKEIKEIIIGELNWDYIIAKTVRHRITGYFLKGLKRLELENHLPNEFAKLLMNMKKYQKMTNNILEGEIVTVNDLLNKNNIRFAFLKGVIFNKTINEYGDRFSNDIDILVPKEELNLLDKILRENGFVQTYAEENLVEASREVKLTQLIYYHDTVPYKKYTYKEEQGWKIELDINFQFDNSDNDVTRIVIENTKEYTKDSNAVIGLSDEDNLIHLYVHFWREYEGEAWVRNGRNLTLYKLIDIYNMFIYFVGSSEDERKLYKLVERAYELNCIKQMHISMLCLAAFFDNDSIISCISVLRNFTNEDEIKEFTSISNHYKELVWRG
ncbi:nucleotidyltransferase family protein [Listeria welshimeri]|nr:nucleotidyltransferase family protein [Listeria welshimeri]